MDYPLNKLLNQESREHLLSAFYFLFEELDFIFQTKDENWKEIKKKYIDPIIIYDEDNKVFKNNLKKIGLKVK